MWTLWLNRNISVFENKFYKIDEVMVLIKFRSYAWCKATSLVPELRTNIWDINPVGIISSHMGSLQKNLLDSSVGFFGFTDGSFVRDDSRIYKSSMGGYLKDKENNLLFIFSGPLQVSSILQAEISAVMHLLKSFEESRFSKEDRVFYLDSVEALNVISRVKLGYEVGSVMIDYSTRDLIRKPNVLFKHISRRLNLGADDLAKQGIERKALIQGWFL